LYLNTVIALVTLFIVTALVGAVVDLVANMNASSEEFRQTITHLNSFMQHKNLPKGITNKECFIVKFQNYVVVFELIIIICMTDKEGSMIRIFSMNFLLGNKKFAWETHFPGYVQKFLCI
jgi:hypothetical protein